MLRRLAPAIALLVGLAQPVAHAQTNIDQGKTPAQIFGNDCAACHKSPRGLGSGRNSLMLSGFLREHYTSSREQAAAMAAYVLGAGSDSATATQGRGQKPEQKPAPEHARATVEEAKPAPARQTRQMGKPDAGGPTANLQPPSDQAGKPADQPKLTDEPGNGRRSTASRHEVQPTIANRGRGRDRGHEAVPTPEPATVVAEPSPAAEPARDGNPAAAAEPGAAASPNAESGEHAPVPRDDIPD